MVILNSNGTDKHRQPQQKPCTHNGRSHGKEVGTAVTVFTCLCVLVGKLLEIVPQPRTEVLEQQHMTEY